MIRAGTHAQSLANRRHLRLENGTTYWKSDFILSAEADRPSPQAFLIEQDPDTEILPHFHQQDQFQVVVGGEGTLGRHRVAPVSVHYAGRYTGYGPIRAGARGVHYFSLRPVTTAKAWFLPESRAQMLDVPRRHLLGAPAAPTAGAPVEAATDALIALQPDGIAAWRCRVPAGRILEAPAAEVPAERFYVVTAGSLRRDGEDLPSPAVLFATADEAPLAGTAGAAGLELLVLQFPYLGRA